MTRSNAKLFSNAGHALESLGRSREALALFRHAAHTVQPDDVGAHVNVGRALAAMGRLEEAEEAYQKAR